MSRTVIKDIKVDVDKCTGCAACTENCIVRNAPYLENLIPVASVKE